MSSTANQYAETLPDVVRSAIGAATDELFVLDPTGSTVGALVRVMTEHDIDDTTVRVVADERTLKRTMNDFAVASNAADLAESGAMSFHASEGDGHTLFASESGVTAVVTAGGQVARLTTEDGAFVDAAVEAGEQRAEEAEPFEFRTPPLSYVRETMAEEIGDAALADFDAVLDVLRNESGTEWESDRLFDAVMISLLVAARNEVLLYDISRWGEDVGVASKATFSRTKTELEEAGFVETEKVPIDIGRPRLRLLPGDDRITGSAQELVEAVRAELG